ncbi:MAG TPA: 6-phosphogluconolactonase [Kofleriaceae bacterium]|nr:6-phosphogluconolactonase [Kofleriaceae bacterium]
MTATVRTFPDVAALARAAADEFGEVARVAIAARGACHVALSGGSTPKTLFGVLAAQGRSALPWDRIELWWGDERCVPPDHKDSNYRMTRETLLAPLGLTRVHRIEGERSPEAAASDYERALVGALGAPPVFDLVWLGMGPDGHTASLFPGSPAVAERQRYVVANPVDSPVAGGKTTRITLTLPAIDAARRVRFLVAGADKAARLHDVIDGPAGRFPAQLVRAADVAWLVDTAAAAQLEAHA